MKRVTERVLRRLPFQNIQFIFNFNGGLCYHHWLLYVAYGQSDRASSFCNFWEIYLMRFHCIFLLFDTSQLLFFSLSDVL